MVQIGSYIAAACAGALLAAGMLSSAWRVAMWRAAHREAVGDIDGAGVGMAIGIGIAGLANPTLATVVYRVPISSASIIIFSWWLVVLLTGWLIVRWSGSVTRSWIPVTTDHSRPTAIIAGVIALAAIPITIWLHVVIQLRDLAIVGQWINPNDSALAVFLFTILIDIVIYFYPVLLLILSLVLLPLTGRMWARRRERHHRRAAATVRPTQRPAQAEPGSTAGDFPSDS
jgi:hypothetical protein